MPPRAGRGETDTSLLAGIAVALGVLAAALAVRVVWLAWRYDFHGGPRYPLESATIALVAAGTLAALLRGSDAETAAAADRSHVPIVALPIFLTASFALYRSTLGLGLLSDDHVLLTMGQAGSFGGGSAWFFRPVPIVLWRVLFAIDSSPAPLHAVNLLLHGLNAFFVAVVGVRLGLARADALAGAAFFLVFPAAPEAVAWASGIQDVLMTTMALGVVIVASRESSSWWPTAAGCGLFAVGLGAKETAICIPVLVAICWLTPSRLRRPQVWRLCLILVAVAAAYSLARVATGVRSGFLIEPSRYFVKQLVTVSFGTLAAPWRSPQSLIEQSRAFAAAAGLTSVLTLSMLAWRRGDARFARAIRLSLWVLAAVAPVYSYFFVDANLEGARYLYLAEAGWALLVADMIWTATKRLPARSLVLALLVGTVLTASAVSLNRELAVWQKAAQLHDRVLDQARAVATVRQCAAMRFRNVPDSLNGAYVFRNGLHEALGIPDGPAPVSGGCDLEWTGDRFVP